MYGATKIAVEMIARTLRKELKRDDIRATAIVPGGFVSALGRGFPPEIVSVLGERIPQLNVAADRVLSDPAHIASLVAYILEQPNEVNISNVVIRPPVAIDY